MVYPADCARSTSRDLRWRGKSKSLARDDSGPVGTAGQLTAVFYFIWPFVDQIRRVLFLIGLIRRIRPIRQILFSIRLICRIGLIRQILFRSV